jgi:hypothetical protein
MNISHIETTSLPNAFAVSSGALRVTDPCYDMETWCAGTLENVKNGIWQAHVGFHDDDHGWGTRVAYLHIIHDNAESHFDHKAEFDSTWVNSDIMVGVDSGQAGFFDLALFDQVCGSEPVKEKFYDEICALTLGDAQWGVHPTGVVSSSGYGDGSYVCLVRRDEEGRAIEAIIVYIGENEDEDD